MYVGGGGGLSFCAVFSFFGINFVTLFFVEIFNYIRYANITTCDIRLHNDFREIFIYLKVVKLYT